jgi:hypothetical protein
VGTYENYIIELMKNKEKEIDALFTNKKDYTERDYDVLFHRLEGQRMILLMLLSGHDNEQIKTVIGKATCFEKGFKYITGKGEHQKAHQITNVNITYEIDGKEQISHEDFCKKI